MNLLQRIARSDSPKLERPFRAFFGYMLQSAGWSDGIRLKRFQYQVPFFCRSNVALTLWVNPNVVDRAEEFAYDFLRPGDTVVDVGANIGCVTAAASLAVGDQGRVISVEAHPRTFRYLQKTIAINSCCSNVTPLNVAVGSKPGMLSFSDEKRKDDNNRVSLSEDTGIRAPCRPLADILSEQAVDHVRLLKVDVEGFEMEVLRGAESILPNVDCLYVEVLEHTLNRFGSSANELIDFLEGHGFRCYRFKDDDLNLVAFSAGESLQRWQAELTPAR
jgi:FkbM family methyltransferase